MLVLVVQSLFFPFKINLEKLGTCRSPETSHIAGQVKIFFICLDGLSHIVGLLAGSAVTRKHNQASSVLPLDRR